MVTTQEARQQLQQYRSQTQAARQQISEYETSLEQARVPALQPTQRELRTSKKPLMARLYRQVYEEQKEKANTQIAEEQRKAKESLKEVEAAEKEAKEYEKQIAEAERLEREAQDKYKSPSSRLRGIEYTGGERPDTTTEYERKYGEVSKKGQRVESGTIVLPEEQAQEFIKEMKFLGYGNVSRSYSLDTNPLIPQEIELPQSIGGRLKGYELMAKKLQEASAKLVSPDLKKSFEQGTERDIPLFLHGTEKEFQVNQRETPIDYVVNVNAEGEITGYEDIKRQQSISVDEFGRRTAKSYTSKKLEGFSFNPLDWVSSGFIVAGKGVEQVVGAVGKGVTTGFTTLGIEKPVDVREQVSAYRLGVSSPGLVSFVPSFLVPEPKIESQAQRAGEGANQFQSQLQAYATKSIIPPSIINAPKTSPIRESKQERLINVMYGRKIGETTTSGLATAGVDVGSYFVPGVGQTRFGLDIGTTTAKLYKGQPVSTTEKVTSGLGAFFLAVKPVLKALKFAETPTGYSIKVPTLIKNEPYGYAVPSINLIKDKTLGYAVPSVLTKQQVSPEIQKVRGIALQTIEGEKPVVYQGIERNLPFTSFVFGAKAEVGLPGKLPSQNVIIKGQSEVYNLMGIAPEVKGQYYLARQTYVTDKGVRGAAESLIKQLPDKRLRSSSQILTLGEKEPQISKAVGMQKKVYDLEQERFVSAGFIGMDIAKQQKGIRVGTSQFISVKLTPPEPLDLFAAPSKAKIVKKAPELFPVTEETLKEAVVQSLKEPKLLSAPKPITSPIKPTIKMAKEVKAGGISTSGITGLIAYPQKQISQPVITYEEYQPLAMNVFAAETPIQTAREEQRQFVSPQFVTGSLTGEREALTQRTAGYQIIKPAVREISLLGLKGETKALTKQKTLQSQLLKNILAQKTIQRTEQKVIQESLFRAGTAVKTKPKVPPIVPILATPEPSVSGLRKILQKVKQPGFVPYTKRKGKIVWLSQKPLTKEKALRLGEKVARETLAARFGIKQKGMVEASAFGESFMPGKEFRAYEIRKGRAVPLLNEFIQKQRYRLAARSEVGEIMAYRKAAKKKKRGFWGI